MNALKNARVNMITAVVELFKTNQEAYAFAPALAEDAEELTLLLPEIEAALEKAALSTADITSAKQGLKARIVAAAKKMIGSGNAHAAHKGDKQLKEQLKQFEKQIIKAKDSELHLHCSNLTTQLKTINAADLAKRGLQAADITAFEAQVSQFKGDVPKTKSVRSETSTEVSKSESLTTQACAIVNDRIAPTLLHIKDSIPDFYAKFEKAATIRKPASTPTQLKLITLDDVTGEKIEGATIRDIGQNFEAKTAENGFATVKNDKKVRTTKNSKNTKNAKNDKNVKKDNLKTDTLEIVKEGYLALQLPMPKLKRGKVNTLTVRLMPNPETQGLKVAG